MLVSSKRRLLERLDDNDVVLDVGGWAKPLARANWVIDLMPYESRGLYGEPDLDPERFGPESWIQRDICDREPYPFDDGEIDFVVCSHTLEDVRDPLWVCAEMNRIAKAGYIEVPSRLDEQTRGVHGPWVGWSHHRWLVDIDPNGLELVFKHHVIHFDERYSFPLAFHQTLSDSDLVHAFWWDESFACRERVLTEPAGLDEYLAGFVSAHLGADRRRFERRRLGRLLARVRR
jgi:methyltransferase family protein